MGESSNIYAVLFEAFLGLGAVAFVLSFGAVILGAVCLWKLFSKAGYAGWKSLILVYNSYVFVCIFAGEKNWWYMFLPYICSVLAAVPVVGWLIGAFGSVLAFLFNYYFHKCYGASTGFAVFGFFFPAISYIIMAFGGKYVYEGPKFDLVDLKNGVFK